MKNFKSFLGFAIAIGFIYLGYYLLSDENMLGVIIGYALIIFWGLLLLFALFKKLTTKKINN